jgi:hypothetical protein
MAETSDWEWGLGIGTVIGTPAMRDLEQLFVALGRSRFRSRFRLRPAEHAYVAEKGLTTLREHARRFILERLAPAQPARDGRQTPMRGHPVFVAQHATATCCRTCLAKWHQIPAGQLLSEGEVTYVAEVILRWIEAHTSPQPPTHAGGAEPQTHRQLPLFD